VTQVEEGSLVQDFQIIEEVLQGKVQAEEAPKVKDSQIIEKDLTIQEKEQIDIQQKRVSGIETQEESLQTTTQDENSEIEIQIQILGEIQAEDQAEDQEEIHALIQVGVQTLEEIQVEDQAKVQKETIEEIIEDRFLTAIILKKRHFIKNP